MASQYQRKNKFLNTSFLLPYEFFTLYTSKEIVKLLIQKGFVFDRASGSHQIFMLPDGSKRVVVPMHNKDLAKGTLISIIKQAGIDKNEL